MSGTVTQKAAYAPDGTEITWKNAGQWSLTGLVKHADGTWASAQHGSSYDSVLSRTRAYFNRNYGTYRLADYAIASIWEATAPIVREYFGTHRLVIARVFKPGQGGWVNVKLHAGRSNIRRLSKQGVTAVEFHLARGIEAPNRLGIGDAQFQMAELLASLRLPKQRMCATAGHGHIPATHKISYTYRGEEPRSTDCVCSSCEQSYSRRTVLTGFTSIPLAR